LASIPQARIKPAADVSLRQSVVASAGFILAWGMLAKTVGLIALARVRSGIPPVDAIRNLERQLEILRWLGLVATVLCLFVFNLAGAVQTWPIFSGSMFLQAVVLLSPGMSMIVVTLLAEHQFGVAMEYTSPGVGTAIRQIGGSMMRFVGWMVVPILGMLGVSDLFSLVPEAWVPWASDLPSGSILGVAMILCIPVLVPLIAKRVWKTRPIVEAELGWIGDLVAAAGMPRLDVRYWDTDMKSANAVVVGFFPGLRSLLLTDRLVRDTPPEQLRLIVLHELAHIRRWHIWLRMLSVVPGWLAAGAIMQWMGTEPATILISNTAAIAATLGLLRLSAHATEFDADRVACELSLRLPVGEREAEGIAAGGDVESRSPAQVQARLLCRTLIEVTGGMKEVKRSSWLHPSVAARCERLLDWADAIDGKQDSDFAGESANGATLRTDAPFSNPGIHPILCGSAAAFAARQPHILETIDEPNRCDYVQG
jgi:Zn-dependent protease with chaperone function